MTRDKIAEIIHNVMADDPAWAGHAYNVRAYAEASESAKQRRLVIADAVVALVAEREQAATLAERERCLRLANESYGRGPTLVTLEPLTRALAAPPQPERTP